MKKKIDKRIIIGIVIVLFFSIFPINIFIKAIILKNNFNNYLNGLSNSVAYTNDRGAFVRYNGDLYKINSFNAENYYRILYVAGQGKVLDSKEDDSNYIVDFGDGSYLHFFEVDKEDHDDFLERNGVCVVYYFKDTDDYYAYVTDRVSYLDLLYIILYSGGSKKIGANSE